MRARRWTAHIGTPASRRRWTDEQLTDAVAASTNMRHVFVALGLAVGGGTWMSMQDHIRRLALETTHWDRPVPPNGVRPRRRFDWSDDEIRRAADGARSVNEVMRRLGLDAANHWVTRTASSCLVEEGIVTWACAECKSPPGESGP